MGESTVRGGAMTFALLACVCVLGFALYQLEMRVDALEARLGDRGEP